jgi:hypothetical protein
MAPPSLNQIHQVTYFRAPNGVRSLKDRATLSAEIAGGARPILRILPIGEHRIRNTDVAHESIYGTPTLQRLARD